MADPDKNKGGPDPSGASSEPRPGALAAGTRLGPYVVIGSLGAGGMGEVYKARDSRLDRSVAIKVLAPELVARPEARQRFEREARAAAALTHSRICRLLDVGREGHTDYLVMELLEGETLASRLQRGKLPLRQALTFGAQIASALVIAHRAGIVHRDLKPANIMLTREGAVLLDFGLARLAGTPAMDGASATEGGPITRTGVILGTVQYMAPEQLEGRDVDARTDIFALGAVLYEMVSGRRAFTGTSTASLIGNILHADPPLLTTLEAMSPPALDRLVQKCLAKDPIDRWQSAAEVEARLEALQDVASDGVSSHGADAGALASRLPRSREDGADAQHVLKGHTRVGYMLVAALILCAAAAAWWMLRGTRMPDPDQSPTSAEHNLRRLTEGGFAAMSPDGRQVAWSQEGHIWVRMTAGGNAVQVTHSTARDEIPDWSPDGSSIVFERYNDGVYVISPLGGDERKVATFAEVNAVGYGWHFPMWSPDDRQIVFAFHPFSAAMRLFLVEPGHAPREVLATFLAGGDWHMPGWHPDGRLTLIGRHRTDGEGIYTVSVDNGRWVKSTIPDELRAKGNIGNVWVPSWPKDARFLYATCDSGGVQNVWRFRMDPDLRVTAMDRMTAGPGSDWWPKVSRDGKRLLFTIITGNSRLWSLPFTSTAGDGIGTPQPVSEEDGEVHHASLSADGSKLAYFYAPLNSASLRQSELRLLTYPVAEPAERIPADRYARMGSAWSHHGNRLAVQAAELSSTGAIVANVLMVREPDGLERVVGECRTASTEAPCQLLPVDWTPDDSAILVTSRVSDDPRSQLTLWSAKAQDPVDAPIGTLVSDDQWNVSQGAFSPDGKWLAFAYGGEFREEKGIAVVRATGGTPKASWQPLAAGFEDIGNPLWAHDGGALYFTSSRHSGRLQVWRVGIAPATGLQTGSPVAVHVPEDELHFILNRSYYPRMAVGPDKLVLPMNSQKISVWLLDNVDR